MKVRHIKRRNHPVYDWRLVGWQDPAPTFGSPDDEPAFRGRGCVFIEGVNLAEYRPLPTFTFERVRRTWSRPG
jgi:hypothetical protein